MKDNKTDEVPTMTELRARLIEKDSELLAKLVGKTVVRKTSEWDEERRVFREFYDIKGISSVELEFSPHKAVMLNFTHGKSMMILNMGQFDSIVGEIGIYGSIREYLESNGFSLFE